MTAEPLSAPAPARRLVWGRKPLRRGATRALALYLWPAALPVAAFFAVLGGDPGAAALMLLVWAPLLAGAALTRAGVAAAAQYEARALAAPPAVPRKLLGAGATGFGVGLATAAAGNGPLEALALAAAAGALHLAAFGPDPLRAKGLDGLSGEALEAAAARIDTARGLLDETVRAIRGTGDAAALARVERLAAGARETLDRLEREPERLRRARRFLAVWLVGARDAAVAYARAGAPAEQRPRFLALAEDLDAQFRRQRDALFADDRARLDVEMELLRERLKIEGG